MTKTKSGKKPGATHAFWMAVHRYSGLAILVFLAFAALTGSLLCFMKPLDEALNADLFAQSRVAGPAPVTRLVETFAQANPDYEVRSFPLAVGPDARIPVKVTARPASDGSGEINQVFLDRATGTLVGARSYDAALDRRGFVELLHDVHYTLLLDAPGRWFMGVVAIAWTISNLVGAYLTFPVRGAFWKQWKRSWKFSFKSPFPRQMLDLHRAAGLWLLIPLMLLAVTSVGFNFFNEAYGPMVEVLVPERDLPLPQVQSPEPLTYTSAVGQARALSQDFPEKWQPASVIYDPENARIGVTLSDDGRLSYHDLGPIYIYFEAASGKVAEVFDPYHGNTNLAMYRWLYPVHSGKIAGLPTIALVFVCGIAVFAMCVTGIYLWWKKRPSRRRPAHKAKANRTRPDNAPRTVAPEPASASAISARSPQ